MKIIVPTRGRLGRQYTIDFLPRDLQADVVVVCPSNEVDRHGLYPYVREGSAQVVCQPDDTMTIAQKRAWIVQHWYDMGVEKIVMMDDDLRFAYRIDDTGTALRQATHDDIRSGFRELEARLSPDCPHAGFGPRQGNNRKEAGWRGPDRMMYVLGYHLPTVVDNAIFGRIETREDMDVTLQLLRAGFPNAVYHTLVVDQAGGYAARGGCEGERTIERSNADADRLAELHPGLVRVTEKAYGTSIPRKEVVCSWQKALQTSKRSGVMNA